MVSTIRLLTASRLRPGLDALALLVVLLLVLVGVGFASVARAAAPCPGVITQNTTLTEDIIASPTGPTECITFGASNITLNMNGKTIDIRALGNSGRAIGSFERSNVTIEGGGGTVKTTYTLFQTAVLALGDIEALDVVTFENVTVRDLKVLNLTADSTPMPASLRSGFGIRLLFIDGAKVTGNETAFYGVGIDLTRSSGSATGGFDAIESNGVKDTSIAGLNLGASSGWRVTKNEVTGNLSVAIGGPGIGLSRGSSFNLITGNKVNANLGPGIRVTGALGGSANTIELNEALRNGTPGVGPDLQDDNAAPSPNTWNTNNRCEFEAGSVPADVCDPRE